MTEILGTLPLTFRDAELFAHVSDPVAEDLSAIARAGDTLFLSCDETAGIERLRPASHGYEDHEHIHLGAFFDLPGGPGGEMDIEGLAVDDGWLWIVGSHALKRGKPEGKDPLAAMGRIVRDPNRYVLGRVPLVPAGDGGVTLGADAERRPQALPMRKKASKLVGWLEGDVLDPFLKLPSKENGLDVEGIAALGSRVWLGLRGPVLRGHCVVLELDLGDDFKPKKRGGRRHRTHLLPSGGLGVRDLALDGDDMLVLLGPVMSTGPSRVLRWRGALGCAASGVHPAELAAELPYRGARDNPEGLVAWPDWGPGAWLLVHDSPEDARLDRERLTLWADIVRLPG